MRPIDADALYDRLSSFIGMFTDEIGFAVNLNQVLDCIDVAPTIEQPTWISVKYRLPKYGEIVFCNTQNFFEVLQWDERADAWVGAYHSYRKEYVTHWMPLPQPPKGVE